MTAVSSTSAPALRLRGVSKSWGGRRVLSDVDLEAPGGRILVLLGASGAGKSTLLRIVAGLEDADDGAVEVGGLVVADPRPLVPAHRRGVGMVFQSLELWPHMTVAENVAFGLEGRPRGASAARHPRVLEVAALVGVPAALLDRSPATLSGGERQRVAIARALAPGPSVLLYDEPLANLDPARRADLRRLVRRLREEGRTTVVYVTHDANEALEMGDRLAVLDEGRVVDEGTPESVYRAPRCLASARALGPASVVPLGDGAAGRVGVLRPEQVVPASDGIAAVVQDVHAAPGGFVFEARTADGRLLLGRSEASLARGASVRLAVVGKPSPVEGGAGVPAPLAETRA
jgi:ABC-type Fe3+/spermidine/putrescine transport system ATPase subunit